MSTVATPPTVTSLLQSRQEVAEGTMAFRFDKSAVFLAGGIGITPFRSMLVQAAQQKLPHRLFLFSSNRRPEDAPFLEELQALEKENPRSR